MKQGKLLLFTLLFLVTVSAAIAQRYDVTDYLGKQGKASIDLNQPYGMAVDSRGNLWIANAGGHNIVYYDGSKFKTAAGAVNNPGYTDGQGVGIRFDTPKGILAGERAGQEVLVVCDAGNNVVRILSIGNISTILNSKALDFTGFNDPSDVEVDADGNLYVADKQNFCIKKIDITGNVTVFAGQEGQSGSDNGDALSKAKFVSPTGLYVDGNDIYVADGTALRKISGGKVTTVSLDPDYDFSYDMGGIFNLTDVEKIGDKWILSDGCTVRRVDNGNSVFQTMAGSNYANDCGYKSADQDTFARFETVYQLFYNASEKTTYVADYGNHLIRKVKEGGVSVIEPKLSTTTLFPNPTKNQVFVQGLAGSKGETINVSIINITGKVVYTKNHTVVGDQLAIQLNDFNAGLYLVTLGIGNDVVTKKLYVK